MTDTDRSVQNESDEDIYAGFADFNSEQELVKVCSFKLTSTCLLISLNDGLYYKRKRKY